MLRSPRSPRYAPCPEVGIYSTRGQAALVGAGPSDLAPRKLSLNWEFEA